VNHIFFNLKYLFLQLIFPRGAAEQFLPAASLVTTVC